MRYLKSALILIIAAFAGELRANLINYEYSGTITSAFSQKMGASDFGINAGDAFRFNITIDSDAQAHQA